VATRKSAKKTRARKPAKQAASSRDRFTRGPRKQRKPGGYGRRLTTHKQRTVWFQSRSAWPFREPSVGLLVEARAAANVALAPQTNAQSWELAGPSNIGGRVTSLACDPASPDRLWLGAAGGGVWHSEDGGKTWQPQWHQQPVLNIGALALDPNDASTIYAATGEANLSADSYPGVGLFQSKDAGKNWNLIAPTDKTGIPSRIGTVAVNPKNSQHLLLGGVSHASGSSDGLHQSRDGGKTWMRDNFAGAQAYRCHAIVFHPIKAGLIYATVSGAAARNGIWTSNDHGQTWKQLPKGLPSADVIGRASLAISPSMPDVMYALLATTDEKVLGVFRTSDGGASWSDVTTTHFAKEGQMSYGNVIVVHPGDPNQVLCGGVDLHRTTDGGKTWEQVTQWDADRGTAQYAHADHHALLMPAARPGMIYDGNDGGLDVSTDSGSNWENRSNGLAITMFYDVDIAQTDARIMCGGAQDNGTIMTTNGQPGAFAEVLGGDGGWTIIDPGDAGHFYASFYNMGIYRWRNWKPSAGPVGPVGLKTPEAADIWMAYLCYDPTNTKTVYVGSTRLWKTTNDAVSWKAVSNVLDASPISAIEVAIADPKRVYVGTENGSLFRSTDGGATWSGNLLGLSPGRMVTRIETSPKNADVIFVTFGNFGIAHLLRSDDGGKTWKDASASQLPDVPHHAVVIFPDRPLTIAVGCDAGVFLSEDLGGTWKNLTGNLPNSMVIDLVYHQKTTTLVAATYGRSIWKLQI